MNSLNIDIQHQDEKCETVASLPMTVSAPVTVAPYIRQLPATISFCGEPTLTPISNDCRDRSSDRCSFVITQNLCIEIPIEIGAITNIGNPQAQCEVLSGDDVSNDFYSSPYIVPNYKGIEPHWATPRIRF